MLCLFKIELYITSDTIGTNIAQWLDSKQTASLCCNISGRDEADILKQILEYIILETIAKQIA